jgi:hypothetical protein
MKSWLQTHILQVTVDSKGSHWELPVMRVFENNTVVLFSKDEWEAHDCASYEIRKNILVCEGVPVVGSWELEEVQ